MNPDHDHQRQRARVFRALHERTRPFVVLNPWDAGSARLLAGAGVEALATTSAGYAASLGVADGAVGLEDAIEHVADIAMATNLPVTADLEQGYADDPAPVAAVITAAGRAGAVGGSIEDLAGRDGRLYDVHLAADRIAAAADAARALPFDFVLTARSEGLGTGLADLDETIRRLQAYQEAGADVLYAPGLSSTAAIRALVTSVDRPVNVIMGLGAPTWSVEELGELGVRRISVGSALARVAYGALLRAVDELRGHGTFGFTADAVPYRTLFDLLGGVPIPTAAGSAA